MPKKRYPVVITIGNPDRAVIFGWSDKPVKAGDDTAYLTGARMVLYWSKECGGLFGLCSNGPQPGTRLTHAVTTDTGPVVRVIHIDAEVAKTFDEWKVYE